MIRLYISSVCFINVRISSVKVSLFISSAESQRKELTLKMKMINCALKTRRALTQRVNPPLALSQQMLNPF